MKKIFTIICSLLILSSSLAAYAYSDLALPHKYFEAVHYITDQSIVSGYPDGTYKPFDALNRAELLKIIVEAVYEDEFESYGDESCFDDVPAEEWYTKYVCFAKDMEFVEGYEDGTFRPDDDINLVEALKISLEVFDYDYSETDPWYKGLVDSASENNFIPLDFFDFDDVINRGQMADLITRILKYEAGELDDYLLFLSDYKVTYETLLNGNDVEAEVRNSIFQKDDYQMVYFENFEYATSLILHTVELYSTDAVQDTAVSCMEGYYSGNWNVEIVNSYNEVIGKAELGELTLPPSNAIHSDEMAFKDSDELRQILLVEEYGDCNGNQFTFYQFSNYLRGLEKIDFTDREVDSIYAESIETIHLGIGELTYTYYDNSIAEYVIRHYDWDGELGAFVPQ